MQPQTLVLEAHQLNAHHTLGPHPVFCPHPIFSLLHPRDSTSASSIQLVRRKAALVVQRVLVEELSFVGPPSMELVPYLPRTALMDLKKPLSHRLSSYLAYLESCLLGDLQAALQKDTFPDPCNSSCRMAWDNLQLDSSMCMKAYRK